MKLQIQNYEKKNEFVQNMNDTNTWKKITRIKKTNEIRLKYPKLSKDTILDQILCSKPEINNKRNFWCKDVMIFFCNF
jgi:hypothetical protein